MWKTSIRISDSQILSFVYPFSHGYKYSWIKQEKTVKVAKSDD